MGDSSREPSDQKWCPLGAQWGPGDKFWALGWRATCVEPTWNTPLGPQTPPGSVFDRRLAESSKAFFYPPDTGLPGFPQNPPKTMFWPFWPCRQNTLKKPSSAPPKCGKTFKKLSPDAFLMVFWGAGGQRRNQRGAPPFGKPWGGKTH